MARARGGEGPTLLVFDCPRGYGHEEGDAQEYRPKDDYRAAVDRDPIALATERFIADGLITQADADAVVAAVDAIVREAVQFGLDSPEPDPSEAYEFVRPTLQQGA